MAAPMYRTVRGTAPGVGALLRSYIGTRLWRVVAVGPAQGLAVPCTCLPLGACARPHALYTALRGVPWQSYAATWAALAVQYPVVWVPPTKPKLHTYLWHPHQGRWHVVAVAPRPGWPR